MSDAALDNERYAGTASSLTPNRRVGYVVYDPLGQKIGEAEEVFVNPDEEPEYVKVRIGLLGRRIVLIPVQFAEMDDERDPRPQVVDLPSWQGKVRFGTRLSGLSTPKGAMTKVSYARDRGNGGSATQQ